MFLRRWAYAPLTLLIVFSCAWLVSLRNGRGFLRRALARIGSFSMEIYLIYENLYLVDPPLFRGADDAGGTYAVTCFAVTLLLSALLQAGLGRLLKGKTGDS